MIYYDDIYYPGDEDDAIAKTHGIKKARYSENMSDVISLKSQTSRYQGMFINCLCKIYS